MTHLTRAELTAWRDRKAPEDRDRVMSHLGGCARCAAVYAELIRTAPAGEPEHFKAVDFVERGYAARRVKAAPVWMSWKVLVPVVSAAAAVVFFVAISLGPGVSDSVRGSRIELTTPAVVSGRAIPLEWTTGLAAPKFLVEVKDSSGSTVLSETTTVPRATIPAERAATLALGTTCSWTVSALDADGQVVTKASGTFVVGPR